MDLNNLYASTDQEIITSKSYLEDYYKNYTLNPNEQNFLAYQNAKADYEYLIEKHELDLLHLRYKRGLGLIKLLYEKVLSLEHHFTGMRTYQNIFRLSNPNAYPEFRESKKLLEEFP